MEQADLWNAASNGGSSGRAGLCNGLDRHCIKIYRLIRVGFESLPVPLFNKQREGGVESRHAQ